MREKQKEPGQCGISEIKGGKVSSVRCSQEGKDRKDREMSGFSN